jgi:ubiquinone/menaquinone biosynthesis C-methylase UbiE
MGDLKHYVIRGGIEGHERLKILSRVMHKSTTSVFDRVGISDGMMCLDFGCGSGDVTIELARRVAPNGRAVGADIDAAKIDLARDEAEKLRVPNVEFRKIDIRDCPASSEFDVVYSRFLLTHLSDPASAVQSFFHHLKPGGLLIVEDIDFSGYFVYPESRAFRRYHELYCMAVRKRGGDPDIGPRVPLLLKKSGFVNIDVAVVQPVGLEGEVKLLNPLTMENIAETVVHEMLATREEVEDLVKELYHYAEDPGTIAGTPRVVQAWGRRPSVENHA